jgi:hypothetical protein
MSKRRRKKYIPENPTGPHKQHTRDADGRVIDPNKTGRVYPLSCDCGRCRVCKHRATVRRLRETRKARADENLRDFEIMLLMESEAGQPIYYRRQNGVIRPKID